MSKVLIERKIYIEARPATIFAYFTEADKLCQWLGKHAKLKAVKSGPLRIDMNGHDIVSGTFQAVEPFDRIVFTWGWAGSDEHPPGSSLVEIVLDPSNDGTWLTLKHTSIPESERECHLDGWNRHLSSLQEALENRLASSSGKEAPHAGIDPGTSLMGLRDIGG
ncbi:SRPBCC domain-containing protein [Paenibacillaceae bacterium WGS1546]|uniref:SRPBCC family protein n=1 Tax=Cohnella sp. WGS1546 TaxID=3366810 RepID=UPI00372D5DFE